MQYKYGYTVHTRSVLYSYCQSGHVKIHTKNEAIFLLLLLELEKLVENVDEVLVHKVGFKNDIKSRILLKTY